MKQPTLNQAKRTANQLLRRMEVRRVKEFQNGTVLIDRDYWYLRNDAVSRVVSVLRLCKLTPNYIRFDRTRRGWHIIVNVYEILTREQTLGLQYIIAWRVGGDWKRECFNFRRLRAGVYLNQLFEPRSK